MSVQVLSRQESITFRICSYRLNTDVTNNFKDNSLPNDSNQVHLQKVIPTEADPDTTLEFDCFNVANESTVAHNRKTGSFSYDLTYVRIKLIPLGSILMRYQNLITSMATMKVFLLTNRRAILH